MTGYDYGGGLIFRFVTQVFPKVDRELTHWANIASGAQEELRCQALASIKTKKFHAQGGSIYALYPGADLERSVKFIVALQTISDYLDNLCDRAGIRDEKAFRQLHTAMLDAVGPDRGMGDYYLYYPYRRDNGYLRLLVEECRKQAGALPSYPLVAAAMENYVRLYSELQTYKHLHPDHREALLISWAANHLGRYPDLAWWEFSAAAGSTLGIFVLFSAAADPGLTPEAAAAIDRAYFPWICGLHILLDYYIDAREDQLTGDLNFTCYYDHLKHCESRLSHFIQRAMDCGRELRYPGFHTTVIKGLLAMYLSDPKASVGLNRLVSRNLIQKVHRGTQIYYDLCRFLRLVEVL